jgi:hypothetical protein
MLSVLMECRYAECRYAECCGATKIYIINPDLESTDDNVFVFSFFQLKIERKLLLFPGLERRKTFFFGVAGGETK